MLDPTVSSRMSCADGIDLVHPCMAAGGSQQCRCDMPRVLLQHAATLRYLLFRMVTGVVGFFVFVSIIVPLVRILVVILSLA